MLEQVLDARSRELSPGFSVGRALPQRARRMIGPFIFLDHMGPVDMPSPLPRDRDVRPHPHIGLSTVTYLLNGEITHRDSLGSNQVIKPGAVNWMTAGHAITHSERFDGLRSHGGGNMHGVQTWVALPEEVETGAPAFDHYPAADLPRWTADGVDGRVIAGRFQGLTGPAKTFSPLFYVHLEMDAGGTVELPGEYSERGVFIVSGALEVEGKTYRANQLLTFAKGGSVGLRAPLAGCIMLLGGEPIGPRYIWWNFVASRRELIEQASADWRAGRMPMPIDDTQERIPVPELPQLAAHPAA